MRRTKVPGLPETVEVMGYSIKIRPMPKTLRSKMDGDLAKSFPHGIRVNPDLPLESRQSTLLHEILHLIIRFSGHDTKLNDQDEESLVCALEAGLWPLVAPAFRPMDETK